MDNPPTMKASADSLLCSVAEASHALCISKTSLYELMRLGHVRSIKIGSRRLIPRASLVNFVNEVGVDLDMEADE